jgi:hypothetical protein
MAGRSPTTASSALRLEILRELQLLDENRDLRDRLDKGPLAAAKGREHWVLHLLLRAAEHQTAHFDFVIAENQGALLGRLEEVEERLRRVEDATTHLRDMLQTLPAALEGGIGDRVQAGLREGATGLEQTLHDSIGRALDDRLPPLGSSIETVAEGSRQAAKTIEDTFRLASQTRQLVTESAHQVSDLGKDLLALEDALKLVVEKAIEEGTASLDRRLSEIERRLSALPPTNGAPADEHPPIPTPESPTAPAERSPT